MLVSINMKTAFLWAVFIVFLATPVCAGLFKKKKPVFSVLFFMVSEGSGIKRCKDVTEISMGVIQEKKGEASRLVLLPINKESLTVTELDNCDSARSQLTRATYDINCGSKLLRKLEKANTRGFKFRQYKGSYDYTHDFTDLLNEVYPTGNCQFTKQTYSDDQLKSLECSIGADLKQKS